MSRLNEIKKIRYKLRNSDFLVLSKEKIEFLCDWAEKGLAAIPKTETTGCKWCDKPNVTMAGSLGTIDMSKAMFCPNCGRRLEETT